MGFETATPPADATSAPSPWLLRARAGEPSEVSGGSGASPLPESVGVGWNEERRAVSIQRDPFGSRPIYWRLDDGFFLASSSARALAAAAEAPLEVDRDAARRALADGLALDASLFRGIRRLPPGHRLVFADGNAEVSAAFELPSFDPTGAADPGPGALRELRDAIVVAIRARAVRPGVGYLLSGGLDSSLLVALSHDAGEEPRRAWSFVLDLPDDAEELKRARAVARSTGTRHAVVALPEASLPETLPQAVWALEDLLLNALPIAKLLFFRRLHYHGVRVAVGGAGADEAFAGAPLALGPEAVDDPTGAALGRAQEAQLTRSLPESTLPAECRSASSAGVEVTLPFLDSGVVAVAARLPRDLRIERTLGKIALRLVAEGLLPEAVRMQPKLPRPVPPGGTTPAMRRLWHDRFEGLLRSGALRELKVADERAVAGLLSLYLRLPAADPDLPAVDRRLMQLASLAVLAGEEAPTAPRAPAPAAPAPDSEPPAA